MPDTYCSDFVSNATTVAATETTITWGASAVDSVPTVAPPTGTLALRIAVITQSLNAFKVYGKVHPADTVWIPLLIAAADYADANSPYVEIAQVFDTNDARVDTDIASIAATQYGQLVISTRGFTAFKLTATAAVAGAVVTIYGNRQ